ncbi:aspartyl-phosphate phosphatase Spo0E family protein [Bacillus salipaludis]|uniref:Aspartyl-phosphate phosphatase Spo0E family protein n=1 Tax=Bacillus salipaludis TaxID=2547811 RepID=A0AA90Z5U1_9BACI|nr:aspartyl-phosphate phosphatase Spo0E family protein [Bacillus salipaludis]MDQ6601072.1 aspartyl-phosphate phosphatase Spo0E family protein [Bacillus salipaludis]
MELMKYVEKYNYLKIEMEKSGTMYGLSDPRTIKYSQELDLLLNKVMKIRYLGIKGRKKQPV